MKKLLISFAAFGAAAFVSCSRQEVTLLVGTYTDSGSCGIYSLKFNQDSGAAVLMDSVRAVNPSYLTVRGRTVYAVREENNGDAAAMAYRLHPGNGRFELLSEAPTEGEDPCYITTNGRIAVTANYSGGSLTVFPVRRGGRIGPPSAIFHGSTGGPDTLRQATAHIHCTVFSPEGKYLYATDFSHDRILRFEVEKRGLKPSADADGQPVSYAVDPDYGPRHLVFSPDGKRAYVIGELSGKVTVFDYADGALNLLQVVDADPYDGRGSADIRLSPDGKFLYASNRLVNDGIAVFKVGKNGLLTEVAYQATRIHPRNFVLTPNGRYLLCACRDSDMIQVFRRDAKTGLLTDTGRSIGLKKPVCVCPLK